jgi:hypothetical protein
MSMTRKAYRTIVHRFLGFWRPLVLSICDRQGRVEGTKGKRRHDGRAAGESFPAATINDGMYQSIVASFLFA